ncbi:SsrA-binding protein SmpB [Propionicimonas sp.]|uniref:SsrA-binding protein SmpB n=1 Tax=Propionicimonas sp. TaxID=1955623 RepID=UPI00181C8E76|nr:SsrA-binding protein SmpB [Propionicimonas sp.]MBU3976158.1 SsrA-binding protein SmpB [Actinomycetota bacterium]MBA3020970.1 SsrA-binding protein SmpB [Propionicimonas sp.]MBU3985553.1 SsrA-binding protein SmpB [Actinomycetota bacterium]MBU4008338.1 SsrA-binding protein SmpB [Actinomycetota bacterium]MBU4066512.1 SsrA-binding protein SmpB [Actinomycetota bacterium]
MPRPKGRVLVAQNRKARHDYHLHDRFEAGMVLTGTEVKSLRLGRASLVDAFATVDDGEVWLRNAHIPEYAFGTWTNHATRRTRKLLLHRKEIAKLERETNSSGQTIVPLAIYFSDGYAKVELAVATGKKDWDKRQTIAARDVERDTRRELAERNRGRR